MALFEEAANPEIEILDENGFNDLLLKELE